MAISSRISVVLATLMSVSVVSYESRYTEISEGIDQLTDYAIEYRDKTISVTNQLNSYAKENNIEGWNQLSADSSQKEITDGINLLLGGEYDDGSEGDNGDNNVVTVLCDKCNVEYEEGTEHICEVVEPPTEEPTVPTWDCCGKPKHEEDTMHYCIYEESTEYILVSWLLDTGVTINWSTSVEKDSDIRFNYTGSIFSSHADLISALQIYLGQHGYTYKTGGLNTDKQYYVTSQKTWSKVMFKYVDFDTIKSYLIQLGE